MFKNAFQKVDKTVFIISAILSIGIIAWSYLARNSFTEVTSAAFGFMLDKFGWLFIICYTVFVIILVILAFSKYGKVRLGATQNEKPEFSKFTWVAMMFAAGQGVGLTYYALTESIDHYYKPMWGVAAKSSEAMGNGLSYTLFHFGFQPWAGYALLGLVIAFFAYNKKAGGLLSTPLTYVWGKKNPDGSPRLNAGWGKVIDSYTVVVSLLGICASLFLACSQVSAGLSYFLGWKNTTSLQIILLVISTAIFTFSSAAGVNKGMAFLSNMNMKLCYLLIAGVFLLGPTIPILENMVEGIGTFLNNYLKMSFFMDANGGTQAVLGFDWMKSWTIYWWAYYLAWTPFVGIFVAKASRGRTIKEFVLGALVLPTVFCFIWITAFGTAGIILDNASGGAIYNAITMDFATCLYALYELLPLTPVFTVATLLVCMTFILTSADSANYCISVLTCRGEINPPGSIRAFWGIIIGAFATVFMLCGGTTAIQNVQFTATLPLLVIMILMFIAFIKELRKTYNTDYALQFRLLDLKKIRKIDAAITPELEEELGITLHPEAEDERTPEPAVCTHEVK